MRITQKTAEHLAAEVMRLSGAQPVQYISHPGDGRTHYVMAESMTNTYYGARQAVAYLLGMLSGLDPEGPVHHVDIRSQWIADIDNAYHFDGIPAAQLAARRAGTERGKYLRDHAYVVTLDPRQLAGQADHIRSLPRMTLSSARDEITRRWTGGHFSLGRIVRVADLTEMPPLPG